MKKILLCVFVLSFINITIGQTVKFGKIKKAELEEDFYKEDSLCNAVYLYKYRKTEIEFNNGTKVFEVVTKIHEKIKIYNSDGFKNATHVIAYYDPETSGDNEEVDKLKAYTYNLEDGKIKKEKLSSKNVFKDRKNKYTVTKTFTMPNIKEGTVIEYSYSIKSPYYSIRELRFQYDIPIKQLNYSTVIPEYFNFTKRMKGYYSIIPKMTKARGSILWSGRTYSGNNSGTGTNYQTESINYSKEVTTFEAEHVPSLKSDEPFVSNIHNYRGGIKYELASTRFPNSNIRTYSTTWDTVSIEIFESPNFGGQLDYSNYFKKDLAAILENTTTNSEKIMTIFEFVKSKVTWNNYSSKYTDKGVKKAYKEGSGNVAEINLMLVSMLREAGFISYPVLLSTRANGVPFFPTSQGLNYVIASVKDESGEYILLDATDKYSSPNNLPLRDLNWDGRMVSENGSSAAISLHSTSYSESRNSLNISIDSDFNVSGLLRRKLNGLQAMQYRNKNNKRKEEDVISNLEKKFNVEINNYRIGNKEASTKPLSQYIQFESSDMVEVINDKLYLDPLFFFSTKINPFKLENRKFPVDYGTPWLEKNKIIIKIPEGYKVESMPNTLGIGMPEELGVFKFVIKSDGKSIMISSEEKINSSTISSEYYNDLRSFYSKIASHQKQKIILSKI